MLQCTDPNRFKPIDTDKKKKYYNQILFVGNSRGIFRKIIKDILPTNYSLSIFGEKWEKLIPEDYIKGQHIENKLLYKYYASADILLNDHWDDMREKGFVSNRIFDGLACQTFMISDKVKDMGDIESYVQTYETKEELNRHLNYFLENPQERESRTKKGMEFVLENHTFKNRAIIFSEKSQQLLTKD